VSSTSMEVIIAKLFNQLVFMDFMKSYFVE